MRMFVINSRNIDIYVEMDLMLLKYFLIKINQALKYSFTLQSFILIKKILQYDQLDFKF